MAKAKTSSRRVKKKVKKIPLVLLITDLQQHDGHHHGPERECCILVVCGTQGVYAPKSTPFAAQMAAEDAGRSAQEHGMQSLGGLKGPGSGREAALRASSPSGSSTLIRDVTPVPQRCRPPKRRRV